MPTHSAAIEIRGAATGLLDEPLLLNARGAGPTDGLLWQARFRDDDGRVWQASADAADALADAWRPAKATTGALAALQSLRPMRLEVRVEAPDGRAATRTLTRALVGEGVRVRRWREPALPATLCLPAGAACAALAIDATSGSGPAAVAALAAPLLASRGVLALVVPPPRERLSAVETLGIACERLAAIPSVTSEVAVVRALDPSDAPSDDDVVVLPPGVAARDGGESVITRAATWDALLAQLGARARAVRQPTVSP